MAETNGSTTATAPTPPEGPPAPEAKSDVPVKIEAPAAPDYAPGFSSRDGFALIQRAATLLAASSLVPQAYRGNMPNCVVALNMAQRIGADPLMVMQNLYVVHGNPGWSAKFLVATFNQSGRWAAMKYEYRGEEGSAERGCRAWSTEKATGETVHGPWVSMKMAAAEGWSTKAGSKWLTMPELMLMYRAAAFFIRVYDPGLAMGLQTAEELRDVIDAEPVGAGRYAVPEVAGESPKPGEGGKLDQLAETLAGSGQ